MSRFIIFIAILICNLTNFVHAGPNDVLTPLEKAGYKELSSHSSLMSYLQELDKTSPVMHMEVIGKSVQGREIPALFFTLDKTFGSNREEKPVVFIFCQQHGNEPSGKEAALVLARELLQDQKEVLKHIDLILIPQVNPDGSEASERRNANERDLNRNHAILSEPEVVAVHQIFQQYFPEVTLDVHEYDAISKSWVAKGFVKDADEQLGTVTNLNISGDIHDFAKKVMIPGIGQKVEDAGFSFHEYLVGSPFENSRLRYSTTAINDGRQSLGIYNTLSFILEGKKYSGMVTNIQRRTEGQLAGMLAFLNTISGNRQEILKIVRESRRKILDESDTNRSLLQMEYFPDSTRTTVNFPVFNLNEWKREYRDLEHFEPDVQVRRSVRKPVAYIIPADQQELIDILNRHQIEMYRLTADAEVPVEIYHIWHVSQMLEEELMIPCVDAELRLEKQVIPAGSRIVFLNQRAGLLLPLLLEPQSSYGLFTEASGRDFSLTGLLQAGTDYPILRLVERSELPLVKKE
jgi:hypothetical protein